jgi:rubredoxin
MSAINEYLKRLASIFGSMGFSVPPDDFSGVVIDGKTYPVMMRNDGCYVYFDDKGVKRLVSDVPRKDYQFINIKDARVSIVNQCYRTPGGQVEARIHTYMNNKGEILAEKIFIINSSDIDIPIGSEFDKIPDGWVAIDCSIAEMTDRELIFVSKCYATEGGKVQIEGVESVDPRLNPEVSHYEVVNTTDDSNPIGTEYDAIPDTWNRIVCDFPDMTQREIIPVLKCFDTGTGRVQIEGYKIFDYEMGTRKEWYRIKQSTDPENPVGKFITSISDDWVEVVCDFTDMEDRMPIDIEECYKTSAGSVRMRHVVSYDGDLGKRNQFWEIVDSSDNRYGLGNRINNIPADFIRERCALERLDDRITRNAVECYSTPGGSVRIKSTYVINPLNHVRSYNHHVLSSTDNDIHVGTQYTSLPSNFARIECEEPDYMDRLIDTTETCYDTGKGTVKIRRQESLNGNLDVKTFDYKIVESTDPDHPINTTPTQTVINGWTVISCDLNIMEVDDCYEVGGHKIHLKGFRTINPALQDIKSILYVVYSDHPDYHAGDELNSIPEGAKVTICDYADKSQRHMVPVRECYEVADGRFYVEGSRLVDNDMVVERMSLMVMESSSPTYPVGTTLTSIPDGATIVACLCQTC